MAGKHTVILGDNLSDNKWHEVKVEREKRILLLQVDELRNQTTTPGSFVSLDLDRFLYVGGLDKSSSGDYGMMTDSFNGCLKKFY